jgi:hypothetical protein
LHPAQLVALQPEQEEEETLERNLSPVDMAQIEISFSKSFPPQEGQVTSSDLDKTNVSKTFPQLLHSNS